ncbi:MAG: signal peptidase I [Bifidobacteriaceae bacterium]|jgi:signal peptidase I|nr:signal peptidase I [Bifidobacteriaceae bacterium]
MSLNGGAQHGALPARKPATPASTVTRGLAEFGFLILLVIVLSFILKTFFIQSFYIPSTSMLPTLEENDRVIVTKLAPNILDLHRGDIVVFHDPGGDTPGDPTDDWGTQGADLPDRDGIGAFIHGVAQALGLAPQSSEEFLIKRVIGLPGDHITCEGNGAPLVINGAAIDESFYIQPGSNPSTQPFDVVVPDGAIWVMGDNRDGSWDSRFHQEQALKGAVSIDDVVGVAQVRSWPFSRFALLKNPAKVFATVGEPVAAT